MLLEGESSKTREEVSALDEWVTASTAYSDALSWSEPLQVVVEMCSDEALGLAPYPIAPASLESAAQAYLTAAEADSAARAGSMHPGTPQGMTPGSVRRRVCLLVEAALIVAREGPTGSRPAQRQDSTAEP